MSPTSPDSSGEHRLDDLSQSMSSASPADAEDPRLINIVNDYMTALEAGRRPNRRELLARYPDIADQIAACLDGLAFVQSAAGQIPGAAPHERIQQHQSEPAIDPASAQPLGDFKLVREIGRGGMGTVYEAVQLSLGRRVAVKLLPMAAALDSRHLERFRNEAQAAAQLHHTNIVPVYAVGCERSVHFYAMQLIEGPSLAEVIANLRQVTRPDAPQPALSPAETTISWPARDSEPAPTTTVQTIPTTPKRPRPATTFPATDISRTGLVPMSNAENLSALRSTRPSAYARSVASLGLQVAEALDYAHRAGIVHRDIKPANLLLDGKGTLWVTDFGLAQFYAENGLTRSGDMVGTMRYMSPEQASGRAVVLDQRTDIYSLGVTLYELLTLERALPGVTHAQLLDQLANQEPKSPRAIDKTIPRELDLILTKAIAKDPADRYATARALADDLRRFLQDEPILARPPSAWDRALKWTRRHRAFALSALCFLTLATVGLLVSTLLVAREQAKTKTAYDLERTKAIEAQIQRQRAERNFDQARRAVDFFSQIAVEMDRPEFSDVRREMLEESASYYQSFIDDRGDDPALDAARARNSKFLALYTTLDESLRAELRARLLTQESVQQELKMTPAEITAALALTEEPRFFRPAGGGGDGGPSDLRTMTPEQRQQRFTQRGAEIEAGIAKILDPDRTERLRQIYRQVRGPLAFSEPDVARKLNLTRDQKIAIRNVLSQYRNARFGPGPRQGDLAQPIERDTTDQILDKLDDTQRQVWSELTGPKFTGRVFIGGPGGGRRFGGPDEGNPGGHRPGGPDDGPGGHRDGDHGNGPRRGGGFGGPPFDGPH